jgi:hypothetical protein
MNTPREEKSLKRVNAVAPIRICDIGGWTDTWFENMARFSISPRTRM